MGKLTRSDWVVALVSVPVVLLALGWLTTLALALTWEHPIWRVQPQNLAEAAAFRDGGAIMRRVSAGENPATAADVRAGFISDTPTRVTPLEAAVRARRPEIVRLLLDDLGTRPDAASWSRAWCTTEDGETRTLLASYRPAGATSDCREESPR